MTRKSIVPSKSRNNLAKPKPAKPKSKLTKSVSGRATLDTSSGRPVFERVYEIVMRIPCGRVLTYGLISDMLGGRLTAQGVGWALKALPDGSVKVKSKTGATAKAKRPGKYTSQTVPWQRVINSRGTTSTYKIGMPPDRQREMLEKEGVVFDHENKVDLDKFLWLEGARDLS